MWEGRGGHTNDSGANGSPAQAKRWWGKLTGVSRNSGWGFGAVELYCWWYTEGSWTWTHTHTNALEQAHTHTQNTHHSNTRVGGRGREFKREKAKEK